MTSVINTCHCGCGSAVGESSKGYQRRFLKGHKGFANIGRIMKPETREKLAARLRKLPRNGVCKTCGKPNPPRNGRVHKYCSVSCAAKARAGIPKSEVWKSKMKDKLPKLIAKMQPIAWAKCRGSHGFGLVKQDNPKHKNAKTYRIRSPLGDLYEVHNLQSWCRHNEDKFYRAGDENFQLPLYQRAHRGMTDLKNGKACSWRGWTSVCVFDIENDPLSRRIADATQYSTIHI